MRCAQRGAAERLSVKFYLLFYPNRRALRIVNLWEPKKLTIFAQPFVCTSDARE